MSQFKYHNEIQLVIVRHGPRADCSEDPIIKSLVGNACNTWLDPTKVGIIVKAGFFIKNKILCNDKFDLVVSSPFIRCIETTFYLTGICNKIKINGRLSEIMNTQVLKEPIDKVIKIVKNDLKIIGIDHQEIEQINIPLIEESRGIGGTAYNRFCDELTNIVEEAIVTGDTNILIVTHADCLSSLVTLCDNKESVYKVDYCGILVAKFNITTKKWSLDYDKCNGVGIIKDY